MKKVVGQSSLEIIRGDITTLEVDVIVNAANVDLQHGGGVARAISHAGGPSIQRESDQLIAQRGGPLQCSEAVFTGGGSLPARHVIHTAGPIWNQQPEQESEKLLRASIRNCLTLAEAEGWLTLAFPAISTGIYHFPFDLAAQFMLEETTDYLQQGSALKRVIFCLFDERAYNAFVSALAAL